MNQYQQQPHEQTKRQYPDKWTSPPAVANSDEGNDENCRPTKIRKTRVRAVESASKQQGKPVNRAPIALSGDCMVNRRGFSPAELLPLHVKPQRQLVRFNAGDAPLCQDALGTCLFGGFLNTLETVQLAAVSKQFQALARDHVHRLDLSRLPRLSVSTLKEILSRYPNLKDINLDYCPQFGDEHLEVLHSLTSLEKLSLRGSRVSGTGVSHFLHTLASRSVYGNRTALKTLDLSATNSKQARNINDGALESIAKTCPHLQVLKLEWCKAITDQGLACLARTQPTKLTQLDLSLTRISNECLPGLQELFGKCPDLQILNVSATALTADALLKALSEAPKHPLALKELWLEFLPELSIHSLSRFFQSFAFSHLERFEISHCEANTIDTTAEAVSRVILASLRA